jgi:hypothetical protein
MSLEIALDGLDRQDARLFSDVIELTLRERPCEIAAPREHRRVLCEHAAQVASRCRLDERLHEVLALLTGHASRR